MPGPVQGVVSESQLALPRRSLLRPRVGPVQLLQRVLVLLNLWPFEGLLRALYRFALGRVIGRVAAHPGVQAVYGTGSFFDGGRCLLGLSDVDFFVVLRPAVQRLDLDRLQIGALYERERRLFPFLGPWYEKEQSLVFLGEVARGFPLLESFRIRAAQGRLTLIAGEAVPAALLEGCGTLRDAVVEAESLLRVAASRRDAHTANLRFWKKLFDKLLGCARAAGLQAFERRVRARDELRFLEEDEAALYFRSAEPAEQFERFDGLARELFAQIAQEAHGVDVEVQVEPAGLVEARPESPALEALRRRVDFSVRTLEPGRLGPFPRFSQIAIEEPLTVLSLRGSLHTGLRAAIGALSAHGAPDESWLIEAGISYLVVKLDEGVDVFPLSPLLYPDVRARLSGTPGRFRAVRALHEEERSLARGSLRALGTLYAQHDGRIHKLPFPCIYREDDRVVLRDVWHRLRGVVALEEGRELSDPRALAAHLGRAHPRSAAFLAELAGWSLHLNGRAPEGRFSNNLFRCAHQFMAKVLEGERDVEVMPHQVHLGLSVGIITRDRAADLREALQSLTSQARPPDEVYVVDNGSTDGTAAVLDAFAKVLPLRHVHLAEASIPKARNAVLEGAAHEIVCFTDDDCVLDPGWLAAIERAFLRADNIGVVGGWVKHHHAPQRSTVDSYYGRYHHDTT